VASRLNVYRPVGMKITFLRFYQGNMRLPCYKPLDTERMFGYYIFSTNERIMTTSTHPQDTWDGHPIMVLHFVDPGALRRKEHDG
jgi:hypothetical protein